MSSPGEFPSVWLATDAAFRAALDEAWKSVMSRGLPVGAVVATSDGVILSRGRNRVYDEQAGIEPLQRTPLAHAEMNALAAMTVGTDLSQCVLYSTHRPCSMCQAAAAFVEVGEIQFLVSDPSELEPGDVYSFAPGVDSRLGLGANVMFLHNVVTVAGPESEILGRNRVGELGVVEFALTLAERRVWIDSVGLSVDTALAGIWVELSDLAQRSRSGR
jgi:tRNA(Arg) A34 adenosine deaminase TadA